MLSEIKSGSISTAVERKIVVAVLHKLVHVVSVSQPCLFHCLSSEGV